MLIDWEAIREECRQSGTFAKIPKKESDCLPEEFHESFMGLSKGAIRQFRDDRAIDSLHIHEFPDYFLVHVDAFNPEHHPVAHGFVDTPGMAVGLVLGAIGVYCLSQILQEKSE